MLYTLEVRIGDGPMTEGFVKRNPVVSRTIQIRSDQTLDQLHRVIFRAFERGDAHMYEFRFGDKFKVAPERRYVMPEAPIGVTSKTTIASLGLREGDVFHYGFDFGDDWWHRVEVESVENRIPDGKFPKVVGRTGDSPPQYIPQDETEA